MEADRAHLSWTPTIEPESSLASHKHHSLQLVLTRRRGGVGEIVSHAKTRRREDAKTRRREGAKARRREGAKARRREGAKKGTA
jgi:hypothetical protein